MRSNMSVQSVSCPGATVPRSIFPCSVNAALHSPVPSRQPCERHSQCFSGLTPAVHHSRSACNDTPPAGRCRHHLVSCRAAATEPTYQWSFSNAAKDAPFIELYLTAPQSPEVLLQELQATAQLFTTPDGSMESHVSTADASKLYSLSRPLLPRYSLLQLAQLLTAVSRLVGGSFRAEAAHGAASSGSSAAADNNTSALSSSPAHGGVDSPSSNGGGSSREGAAWAQDVLSAAFPLLGSSGSIPNSASADGAVSASRAAQHSTAASPAALSALAWGISECGAMPDAQWFGAFCAAVSARLQDFFAADLCRLVCALGSIVAVGADATGSSVAAAAGSDSEAVSASGGGSSGHGSSSSSIGGTSGANSSSAVTADNTGQDALSTPSVLSRQQYSLPLHTSTSSSTTTSPSASSSCTSQQQQPQHQSGALASTQYVPTSASATSNPALHLPPVLLTALTAEVQYQLTEFAPDFSAQDLARLASGLADLGFSPDAAFVKVLMLAVYPAMHTIEDKAAVDFALAKLNAGSRSLKYDPRWTYAEMGWLPGHERDKQRIQKENFTPNQWGGF